MKKIELIEIPFDGSVPIHAHPRQAELYNGSVDANFIESIKLHGIKQMPVVALATEVFENASEYKGYVIISGHRRFEGAEKAGLLSIVCELRHYDNYFDTEVDHIVFNKQRKKTKKEIAGELIAYKQKLDQVRKELADNGLEGIVKYKSFNVTHHVKKDKDGVYCLPFATEMIEKDLGISKKHQEQLNVIFNDDWVQDKIELIFHSKLNKKEKDKLTKMFSEHVDDGRAEVDKENGLSVNKVHGELIRAWNQIDSFINPKPKEKKTKKKSTSKVWTKIKDFVRSEDTIDFDNYVDSRPIECEKENELILITKGKYYIIDTKILVKYLKEQL